MFTWIRVMDAEILALLSHGSKSNISCIKIAKSMKNFVSDRIRNILWCLKSTGYEVRVDLVF
jgi:hypothetical protein